MAPNRKGAFDAVDSLATLNVSQFVDKSQFQPLTTAVTPACSNPTKVTSTPAPKPAEESIPRFQDPADQALVDRILLEERLREQFSADHIVRTEQQRHDDAEEQQTDLHREDTNSDDYWAMTTEPKDVSEIARARKTDASYWDWHENAKQQKKNDLIEAILEQERVRELFSVDHMVLKIQEEAASLQKKQEVALPQNDTYWSWSGAEVDLNDKDLQPDKEAIIQHILESEKLRQQFSAAALEEKLTQEAKVSEEDPSRAVAANDDYWAGF